MSATTLLTTAYALIALGAIRPIAGHFAWSWHHAEVARGFGTVDRRPDGLMWGVAVVLGALVGAAWPAVAIWALTAALGPVGAERRQLLLERERRVADLEATLDLQGDPHP